MAKKKTTTRKSTATQKTAKKLDETGRRSGEDRRKQDIPVAIDRRKVKRRRQIDPTTCERDYNDAEIQFMQAMDEYKRASGRMFPTCSEILEVILKLGYRQVGEPTEIYAPDSDENTEQQNNTEFEDDVVESNELEEPVV